MKNLNVFLLLVFLLISCSPQVTAVPTSIPTQTFTETPTLTPFPTSTLTPLPITFVYQDNIPVSARNLQEQAAYKAYLYYSQYVNLGNITVYTATDIDVILDYIYPALQADYGNTKSFARAFWKNTGGYIAGNDAVINASYFVWQDEQNRCYKAKNVAHEMFHIVQKKLLNHALNQKIAYGPEWIKEGSAEVFGYKIANGINGCDYNTHGPNWWQQDSIGGASLINLEGGDFPNQPKFWSIAPLAVDYLITLSSQGEKSVAQYYSEIGNGKPWREAFKISFGFSVEDFYEKFKAFRLDFETTTKATVTAQMSIDLTATLQAKPNSSVCGAQTDSRVTCIGKQIDEFNKEVYVFRIQPIVLTEPDQWNVISNCEVTGYGYWPVSLDTYDVVFNLSSFSKGECKVEFTFSADQQAVVHLVIP